jgi:4-diphosphocytidyl-2C-methyl-D-erythritol kinase
MFASESIIKNSKPVDINTAINSNKNCFELAVKKSSGTIEQEIKLLNEVSKKCVKPATITGSGSCFFTTFKLYADAEYAQNLFINLKASNSYCLLTKGCNKSLLHKSIFGG